MKRIPIILALIAAATMMGCAGLRPDRGQGGLPAHYESLAVTYENRGDLKSALYYRRILQDVSPEDDQAKAQVSRLEAMIAHRVAGHLKNAAAYYEKNAYEAARTELMTALKYDPDSKEALEFLKSKAPRQGLLRYKVVKGDSFQSIAQKVYGDPEKDSLVAFFMGQKMTEFPQPGIHVKLPNLSRWPAKDPTTPQPPPDVIKEKLSEAGMLFGEKKYHEVLETTAGILKMDPDNKDAAHFRNDSYYCLGNVLENEGRYRDAMAMFLSVDSAYAGIQERLAGLKKRMHELAEAAYVKGVKHFVNEDLDMAIHAWQRTLDLNPEHGMAKRDIEKARHLLERLKQIR